MRMQPKIVTHFLTYYINWLISLWFTRRRRASQKGNSHAENAPNAPTSEMPSRVNSELSQYATVQSEASAPAQSTNASTSSAPAPRYSQHDTTLIENDLYVNRGVFKLNWTDFDWPTSLQVDSVTRHAITRTDFPNRVIEDLVTPGSRTPARITGYRREHGIYCYNADSITLGVRQDMD